MLNSNTICSDFLSVSASYLDNLFRKENLKIEDILNQDDILTELKINNEKFGKLIRRVPTLIKNLLDYCIIEQINEQNQGYKFPFLASEIFSLNNADLTSCFFDVFNKVNEEIASENKEEIEGIKLLNYLFNFLENRNFNPTTAGYIQKILDSLLNVRGIDFLNYIFSNGTISILMKHNEHVSFTNFLVKILKLDTPLIENNLFLYVDERINITEKLLTIYHESHEDLILENLSYIFIDILENYSKINAGLKLVEVFSLPKNLLIFFDDLKSKNIDETYYSALVIIKIITIFGEKAQLNKCICEESPLIIKGQMNDYQRVLACLLDHLPCIIAIITNEHLKKEISLSCGMVLAFGKTRLKLVEIILVCFKNVKDRKIINKLFEENILNKLLRLFEVYKFNTFLHQLIQQIFFVLFEDEFYLKHRFDSLMNKSKLIPFILEKFLEEEKIIKRKNDPELPNAYLSHLYMITIYIEKASEKNQCLKQYLDKNEEWINFEENQFERLKEKNQKHLGDHNPKIKRDLVFRNSLNEDEDEEEEDDELKGKIFEKYTSYFHASPTSNDKHMLLDDDDDDDDNNLYFHFDYSCEEDDERKFSNDKQEEEATKKENNGKNNSNKDIKNLNIDTNSSISKKILEKIQKKDEEKKEENYYNDYKFWKLSLEFDEIQLIKDLIP